MGESTSFARPAVAFFVVLLGLLTVEALFGEVPATVGVWFIVGAVAGAITGSARQAWIAAPAAVAAYPVSVALGLAPRLGPWWLLLAGLTAIVLAAGLAIGATLGSGRSPWTVARASWAGASRRARAAVAGVAAVSLVILTGYVGYVAVVGSDMFLHPDRDAACTTPAQAFGWTYEAINYELADDARLAAANPDSRHCASRGVEAGTAVTSPDGIGIAGWYIPGADDLSPTGPTIVLVHGWHGNKSGMLPFAAPLHDQFNLVLIDLRDSGRSSPAEVTMGIREATDLEAMLDWLVVTKHPTWIGAVGNSMGGATVLNAAAHDQRIRAVLLESTHASLITSGGNIAENEHGYPAQPTGWAISVGASWRIGQDVTSIDPERTIRQLGDRPVLIIHGTADSVDYPTSSAELNLRAALDAGVTAGLVYCTGGRHGRSVVDCPELWAEWANTFFVSAARSPVPS